MPLFGRHRSAPSPDNLKGRKIKAFTVLQLWVDPTSTEGHRVIIEIVDKRTPKSSLRRLRRKGGFGVSQEPKGDGENLIFTQADIDLLRLLRWGRHILPEGFAGVCSQRNVENLATLGYIKFHERSGSFVLTASGNQLLNDTISHLPPDTPPSYRPTETQRRVRLSQFLMTAYRGHVQVFTTEVEELSSTPSLFLPAITRGRGHNPWGNTRVAALAHLGNLLCAIHYVCPGIGRLSLTDELTAFNNHTAQFSDVRRTFLFTGETYGEVLAEVDNEGKQADSKLISYGEAYRSLRLPIYLLSCDSVGAVQLQIMAEPDYRPRLTRIALKSNYQPPPKEVPAWDAMYKGVPFIMAADMELRRIDAALEAAKEQGISQIGIAALEEQGETVLLPRYRGQARFYVISEKMVTELLGRSPLPYAPPRTQYLTEKGDVVDAPSIQAVGKAGKAVGKAGGYHHP